jgi:hypothetical protein
MHAIRSIQSASGALCLLSLLLFGTRRQRVGWVSRRLALTPCGLPDSQSRQLVCGAWKSDSSFVVDDGPAAQPADSHVQFQVFLS